MMEGNPSPLKWGGIFYSQNVIYLLTNIKNTYFKNEVIDLTQHGHDCGLER